ncbi:MAG: sialidase family protein [Algoriphagus sp.]|uniref:sialidase family protein n=1 Tax=Algoriphagus sp. TaxID=1872435 RepID=UPI002733CD92|nr:sialidase family protein [Algoriphagus sp.]MDP3470946.1 sialidase family protein [Algoriphagus sp.]
MNILNKFIFLSLIVGTFSSILGNCQNTSNSKVSASFEPIYVPVPQGLFVTIGTINLGEATQLENGNIVLTIQAEEPLEELQLTGFINEKETEVLASLKDVSGDVSLNFKSSLLSEFTKLHVLIKVHSTHNLKDRIQVTPKFLSFDSKSYPIELERQIPALRIATPLRTFGDDGINSFRIPGLVTSTKGTLLAVYDIRRNTSRDLQGDIDVGLSRSVDGGKTWEPMQVIMDMGKWGGLPEIENGIGDPAILVDHETGHIWVAALWMHGKPGEMAWNSSRPGMSPKETGQFVLVKSEDDGVTWSEPMVITDQIKKPEWNLFFNGPGKGITMKNGTLVFPAQYKDKDQMPHSTIIYSKDKGKSWHVGTGAKSNTTEAQVVELQDGSLMLNMRDNRGGSRSVSVTKDFGTSWTEHSTSRSALPEPVCMASIIENQYNPTMLLFSNPATEKGRKNITIKASLDNGKSWPSQHHVLLDEGTGWGYSCLTMINEEEVGILYESSVANMTFQIIPLKEILGEK